MRKTMIVMALALACGVGTAAAQQRDSARALERRADSLRTEMRNLSRQLADVQRQLGEQRWEVMVNPRAAPEPLVAVWSMNQPRLGVILSDESDPVTDSVGVRIQGVSPDGPAAKAGLKAGDVLTKLDGHSVAAQEERFFQPGPTDRVVRVMHDLDLKDGDTVHVEYRRGKTARTADVVVRDLGPSAFTFSLSDSAIRSTLDRSRRAIERLRVLPEPAGGLMSVYVGRPWADMELTALNPDLGGYFGTREGLLVVRAPSDSALNLKAGDVILAIGDRTPSTPSQALRILRSYDSGDHVTMTIMRNKKRMTITGTVPRR